MRVVGWVLWALTATVIGLVADGVHVVREIAQEFIVKELCARAMMTTTTWHSKKHFCQRRHIVLVGLDVDRSRCRQHFSRLNFRVVALRRIGATLGCCGPSTRPDQDRNVPMLWLTRRRTRGGPRTCGSCFPRSIHFYPPTIAVFWKQPKTPLPVLAMLYLQEGRTLALPRLPRRPPPQTTFDAHRTLGDLDTVTASHICPTS